MRKLLLVMSCVVAMGASAQMQNLSIQGKPQPVRMDRKMLKNKATAVLDNAKTAKTSGPRRAAADGVYYKTPQGSMWLITEEPFYGYSYAYHVLAPWTEFEYENKSILKKGKWYYNLDEGLYDVTEYFADEKNNFWNSFSGGEGYYYSPIYEEGNVQYAPAAEKGEAVGYVGPTNNLSPLPTNLTTTEMYGMGSLQPHENLYGAGQLQYQTGETGTAVGVRYCMHKPMRPLYVEKIFLWGLVTDNTLSPMPEGTELTMMVYNMENTEADPIVLTCKVEDLVFDEEYDGWNFYIVNFTKKVIDEVSREEVAEPFVIDYPAEIYVLGVNQDGVNLGFPGVVTPAEFMDNSEEATDFDQAYFIVQVDQTGEVRYHYYGYCVPVVGFTSMFEVVDVLAEAETEQGVIKDLDGVVVSADGTDCVNYVDEEMPGVEVTTALDWTDTKTGEDLYWSDDMYDYDWINNLVLTQFADSEGQAIGGAYAVGVECQPLPAGETVRYARIHLNGRGVTSGPIYIIQGKGTIEECKRVTAVNSVKAATIANDKFFNIAGQNVKKATKGLIINNGKKYLVK